jgi:predicted DNA-binding transcriptional regulator YafY
MTTETLGQRIAQAKLHLNTLLLTGESTTAARAALRMLEDEQRALYAAAAADQANKQAAQQSLQQIEADRIANDAAQLAAARANRIAMIGQRFRIPDARSI